MQTGQDTKVTMGRRKSAISMYSMSSQVYQGKCCFGGTRKISGFNEYPTGFFKKSPKEPKSTLLTGQQRLSIIRTWRKIASDIGPLGISAMNKMLELDYDAKMLFEFSHKNDQDMQHDRRFRQHAFWLIQAVNAVLENLDRLDETVAHMFKQIGEKHAAIPRFHISYFGLLPDVWDYVWEEHLKERYSQHTQTSWDRIFQYIVDRLAEGYYLQAPFEPTAGPSSNSTFSLLSNRSETNSMFSTTSPSSSVDSLSVSVSVSGRATSPTSTSSMSLQKKDSEAAHKTKKGSQKKSAGVLESPPDSEATKSQMSSVQSSDPDQDIGSPDMRKRGGSKASTRTKGSHKMSSSRKLSEPTKESSTASSAKPRKTSATSEPTPGNDVTSAAQAPSHNNPPPSEEPVVTRAGKAPSPKQKKGNEISMV